jgi:hypothetical protein
MRDPSSTVLLPLKLLRSVAMYPGVAVLILMCACASLRRKALTRLHACRGIIAYTARPAASQPSQHDYMAWCEKVLPRGEY